MEIEEIDNIKYSVCCPMCDNKKCVKDTNSCEAEQWAKRKVESEEKKMRKEEKDKILKTLIEDRNSYARDCIRRIAEENGKIAGADYMLQRFLDILNTEVESKESENE